MKSLLDILNEEDRLIKERGTNFDSQVRLLHIIEDIETYPRIYASSLDDLPRYKDEVQTLKKREAEIEDELKKVRTSICRYLLRLFER